MIPLVYTTPSFTIISHFSFLSFASSLLPHRFRSITHLHLDLGREEVYKFGNSQSQERSLPGPTRRPLPTRFVHHLNDRLSLKIIRSLTHNNSGLFKLLDLKCPDPYWRIIGNILSQMDGLQDLRIVIWATHLNSGVSNMREWIICPDKILSRMRDMEKSPILQIAQPNSAGHETARIGFKWQLTGAPGPEYDWVLFEGEDDYHPDRW